jgi:hypothetical protein
MGLLACTKCKVEYEESLDNFPPHKKTNNKLDSWCRPCRRKYRKQYRKPPDGIEKEEWNKFNNLTDCVICGKEENLVTDHCHSTLIVRGRLCQNCNLGLGHFKDDPMLLEFARMYLLNYSENKEDHEELENYIETYS